MNFEKPSLTKDVFTTTSNGTSRLTNEQLDDIVKFGSQSKHWYPMALANTAVELLQARLDSKAKEERENSLMGGACKFEGTQAEWWEMVAHSTEKSLNEARAEIDEQRANVEFCKGEISRLAASAAALSQAFFDNAEEVSKGLYLVMADEIGLVKPEKGKETA
jgi:hypothetical protein